jgi:hypothetical protein
LESGLTRPQDFYLCDKSNNNEKATVNEQSDLNRERKKICLAKVDVYPTKLFKGGNKERNKILGIEKGTSFSVSRLTIKGKKGY